MKNPLRKMRSNGKKNSGFSLIEIVLVLVILGGLTILTMQAFNDSDDTAQAQQEITNLQSLSGAVRHMFNTQGNYDGITNTVMLTSVSFPEQMRVPGSTTLIKHSWLNNGVTLASANELGTPHDSFNITYLQVPTGACTAIASSTYRHFDRVDVNGTAITGVANATTSCAAATNTMVFTAR